MTELAEDRVFARCGRRAGAVLIVGAGAVGGFAAEELARLGFSPLWLVDPDVLDVENLIRHPLGAAALGQPKASGLARKIRAEFPLCDAAGLDADFLALADAEQLRLASRADLVVAATDSTECQRRVNEVALAAGKPAVYPGVWVDSRLRDAEVGELLWVAPGGQTPCYLCATTFRRAGSDAQAARGARVDIQLVALSAARVVAALLGPPDERAAVLDPARNAIYLHGLTPVSDAVRDVFPGQGMQSRNVRIRFPPVPCPACGGWEPPAPRRPGTARRATGRAAGQPSAWRSAGGRRAAGDNAPARGEAGAGAGLGPSREAGEGDGERLSMIATLVTAALIAVVVTALMLGLALSPQRRVRRCGGSGLLAGAAHCQSWSPAAPGRALK